MPGFVLCHGWGYDAASLAPLAAELRARFPAHELLMHDLGLFGAARDAIGAAAARDDGGWIGVGHSYGFVLLAGAAAPRWRGLVAINGFLRFCRAPGRRTGASPRAVDAMLARLEIDPAGCLADFRARCGLAGAAPTGAPDLAALIAHLRRLRDCDLAAPEAPLLAIAADADAIVTPDHARAQFGTGQDLLMLAGDHLLPATAPAICADAIARFVGALPEPA